MINLKKFLTFIFLLVILGCDNNRPVSEPMNTGSLRLEDAEQAMNSSPSRLQPKQAGEIERKFIRNGQIDFETEDINKTRERIFSAIKNSGGYISSENEYKNPYEISTTISIRVPADNFDKLIAEITYGVKRFDRKEIYVQDVTEEFIDIEARLKTKRELENKYLEILKRANSVSEILEVEKQIGELRSEIESFEGRLKFLNDQVSLSTLTVRIYEPLSKHTEFGKKFIDGFKNGWDNLILFFVLLVNIWPFIIIIIAILIFFRVWKRKKRARM